MPSQIEGVFHVLLFLLISVDRPPLLFSSIVENVGF